MIKFDFTSKRFYAILIGMEFVKRGLLRVEKPDVFARLVREPNDGLDDITSGSGRVVNWKCYCGIEFTRAIQVVVKKSRYRCLVCSKAGKSRLEYEVAEGLSTVLRTPVVTHYGSERKYEVDIYIPSLDLAIQLDPFYSHHKKNESDGRILKRMKQNYSKVLRVRETGLGKLPNSIYIPQGKINIDWVKAICDYLKVDFAACSEQEMEKAFTTANQKWDTSFSEPLQFNIANSVYGHQFVKNITHPGRKPEYTPRKCSDKCLWKCQNCSNTWIAAISLRRNQNGCPECSYKVSGLKQSLPKVGQSVPENSPAMVSRFVKNLSHPERSIEQLRITSGDLCQWKCPVGHLTEQSVYSKFRAPEACRVCRENERVAKKLANFKEPKKNLTHQYPFLIDEHRPEPGEKPIQLRGNESRTPIKWQCRDCGIEFMASMNSRFYKIKRRVDTGRPLTCNHQIIKERPRPRKIQNNS